MSKKKKVILIIAIIILILAIITGVMFWIKNGKNAENSDLDVSKSKINKLYSELEKKESFSFKAILDNKNDIYYVKKGKQAYIETDYEGKKTKFIIKDGNTYLLLDDEKSYYTYKNNETELDKIVNQLETVKDEQYIEGKEKIENKQYVYNEYVDVDEFLIKDVDEQQAKTRFYFKGDKLVYIKTIVGEYEEILKVDISDEVDDKLFEIPSNYKKM